MKIYQEAKKIMQKFIVKLTNQDTTLIDDTALECFDVDTAQNGADKLTAQITAKNKIALLEGENACDMCKSWSADGVLIDLSKSEHCAKDVNFARKQIGDKVLGVISRNRRHEAMLISECEPDFVAFKAWQQGVEQTRELVAWYNEMFLIQSAVIPEEEIADVQNFECDIIIISAQKYASIF